MATATINPVGDLVALATGESRPIASVDAHGAYICPWCGGPVFPADREWASRQCHNPACLAYPSLSVEYVRAEQARREQARQAEEDRKRSSEAMRAYFERDRREGEERWEAVRAEAVKREACLDCLRRSRWRYGEPKYVRHQTADYHERRAS